MTHFTQEEKLIIGMYGSQGRLITASKIRAAAADADNEALRDLMRSAAEKLMRITEREYRQLPGSLIL